MTLDELNKKLQELIYYYDKDPMCYHDDPELVAVLKECEVLLGAYTLSVNTLATHHTFFNKDRKCMVNHCSYIDNGRCQHQTTKECIDLHAEGFMHSSRLMIDHANGVKNNG